MLNIMDRDRSFIIAEAGTCHAAEYEGARVRQAMDYVDAAKAANADAIKFQVFDRPSSDSMFCWIEGDEERYQRWWDSTIPLSGWKKVKKFAEDEGLVFLASMFEHHTVSWLNELGCVATKVASRATRNFPYYKAPKPYLVSNGMYKAPQIDGVIVLQCESLYPSFAKWEGRHPGFSDHSATPWRAMDAMARGCRLIEVHFYIEEDDAGPDLPASLTLEQLELVCEARDGLSSLHL